MKYSVHFKRAASHKIYHIETLENQIEDVQDILNIR